MGLPLPCSLTPTKVAAFKDCAYAFRLAVIDKVPQPLSAWTVKGVLAHRALEAFYFSVTPRERTRARAREVTEQILQMERAHGYATCFLDQLPPHAADQLFAEVHELVQNLFEVEDPSRTHAIGAELMLEADMGGWLARGVIDRLDLDRHGDLVVVDYKTGRSPTVAHQRDKLGGVLFYAMLVERVIGVRPRTVRLLYLKDQVVIECNASEQRLAATAHRMDAVWDAVRRACEHESFRPRPSRLCNTCAYRSLCPVMTVAERANALS